jgi:hypothetical protein
MIFGLSTSAFTTLHVVISLIAIATSFIVMYGMTDSKPMPGWTAICLFFTVLTTVTGFMFPISGFTPALATGIISSVLLIVALIALYAKHLTGAWRWIYVVTAIAAFWFNVFVLIVQSFEKVSFLNPAAPMVGPPFAEPVNTRFIIAQAVALVLFLLIGAIAAKKFHPGSLRQM